MCSGNHDRCRWTGAKYACPHCLISEYIGIQRDSVSKYISFLLVCVLALSVIAYLHNFEKNVPYFFIIMQKFGLHNRAWVNFYNEQNHVWKKSYKNASGMEEYSEMWSYYVTSWLHKSICCDKCMMISYFLWLIYNNLVMSSRSYGRLFIADYHTFPYDLMVQMNHLKRKKQENKYYIRFSNQHISQHVHLQNIKSSAVNFYR